MPEPDCDMDSVPQGDAVYETDTVPLELAADDGDDIGEPDALSDQLFELVPDEVSELESVDEIVEDVESVPDPDCDVERVPQGDAVKDTDTVPHGDAEADEQMVSEPDGLPENVFELVPDDENELVKVGEMVGDVECVPDSDCDMVCVLHGDAVKEPDMVQHVLTDDDGDENDELDGLTVPLSSLDIDAL